MHKGQAIILAGLGAITLTGAAAAASQDRHTMNVPLPDGSTARIEYVGSVAPKVTIEPTTMAESMGFGMFDRSFAGLQRQIDAMMRRLDQVAKRPMAGSPGVNVAAYGNMPAGSTSVTVVSTSNGKTTCTRTTEVTSQGPGKPPKAVTNFSGNCSGGSESAMPVPTT